MKKTAFILGFALVSGVMHSQIAYDLPTDYVRGQIFSANSITGGVEYQGSPYLNDEFKPGRVYTELGDYPVLLRYNTYASVFEVKTGKDNTGQLQKTKNMKVKVGNRNFELAKLPDGKDVYLEKLAEGTLTLWANHTCRFREAKKNESSYGSDKPAAFISSTEYYSGTPGNLSALKLKKKEVLVLMSDHA
ncbi:MAG: hypothetical protein R3356_09160, partial [Eudoraea sp.]|nr:hypothetical protein [Eudoraea sp.]